MVLMLTKIRKARNRKQAEVIVKKGLNYLEDNFQHKAMYEFQKASELDAEIVSEYLSDRLEKSLKKNLYETALSIGSIIMKIKDRDFELANKLGNCARKLKRYKQANNLYRQALRFNRKYTIALYNLAASMGRIHHYDNDVKLLVDRFDKTEELVLPRYRIAPDFIDRTIVRIKKEKTAELEGSEVVTDQIDSEVEESDLLALKTKKGKKELLEPKYSEVCGSIRRLIELASKDLSTESRIAEFENYIFNLGLYALSKKDAGLAQKCFLQLKKRKSKIEYLDMLMTLAISVEDPSDEVMESMMKLLAEDKSNRYLNVNLGLLYKRQRNNLLSYKYLAMGALLLDQTNNVYCRNELLEMADKEIEIGNLKKAHKIYEMVNHEIENVHVKSNIGQILIYQNQYSAAIPIYKRILELDPKFDQANQKLDEIHDHYLKEGEEMFYVRKFSNSVKFYEKALSARRLPETIKITANVYHQLMDFKAEKALLGEYRELKCQQKKKDKEKLRLDYVQKGKEHLLNKKFDEAVEFFEKAFSMKVDKDVFVYLAHILKTQKRTQELKYLMDRWKKMLQTEGISFDQI